MKMFPISVAVMGALAAAPAAAQRPSTGAVRGVVIAATDRRPLKGASVRLLNQHVAETTHGDGTFLIASLPAGPQRLLVNAIGYRSSLGTVQVVAGDTISIEVVLTEAVLQLEEIVTTGTIGARTQSEVLSPTSVVSGAALDRQLDGTIAGSLRHEPGVAQSGLSPSTAQPVIRGLSGDRVLVLQDGLRVGDLSSMSADHAVAVDPLTVQRIEVVRGPMSLLYGSSALGGVVNVVRQDGFRIDGEIYIELDGSTPAGHRQKLIQRFQGGEGDVFLISLKAAYSVVVLPDPVGPVTSTMP